MKNKIFYTVIICLFIFFNGCTIESVEEYNNRVNNTKSNLEDIVTRTSQDRGEISDNINLVSDTSKTTTVIETSEDNNVSQTLEKQSQEIVSQQRDLSTTQGTKSQTAIYQTPTQTEIISETEVKTINVYIEIRCDIAVDNYDKLNASAKVDGIVPDDGIILNETNISVPENSTVFSVLKDICVSNGIKLSYTGNEKRKTVYINGINGLYEKDLGSMSGWVYSVNGKFLNIGCSGINVNEGDRIIFNYTDGTIID